MGNSLQDHPYASLILDLANVFPSPIDLERNATFDAEQRALFYANRTGTWTAGAPNSVAFLPLANYTSASRAAAILARYAAQPAAAHLRPGLHPSVIAGFARQRHVLLSRLAGPHMAAM